MGKMILGDSVLVQDPCYERNVCQDRVRVVPGAWRFTVSRSSKSHNFIGEGLNTRPTALLAWSETIERPEIPDLRKNGTRLPFSVGVDSGQIAIVCDDFYPTEEAEFEYHGDTFYSRACEMTLSDKAFGPVKDASGVARGVACATHWGDGSYPAFAKFDAEGRAVAITVITR